MLHVSFYKKKKNHLFLYLILHPFFEIGCGDLKDCESCTNCFNCDFEIVNKCGWCSSSQTCIEKEKERTCKSPIKTSCSK